jgi:hypothetical protein
MANEDLKFKIGAEDTGVAATMAKIQATVESSVAEIKASVSSISDAFAMVNEAFIAFAAILAGGTAFKDAIQNTVNMTVESIALGKQLGISTTEASQFKVALASVFVTQDEYLAAANKLTMGLKKNEAGFNEVGVATRDANGNLLSTQQIVQNTTAYLLTLKAGQDRNLEGVRLLGRGYQAFIPVMRLTAEALAEAKIKADALGLTIGTESEGAVKKYRSAMEDVHLVILAVEKVIAEAIMPTLTALGEWFDKHGPETVAVFRTAMAGLGTVCEALWSVLKSLGEVLLSLLSPFTQFSKLFGGEALSNMELFINAIKAIELLFIGLRVAFQLAAEYIIGIIEHWMTVIKQWAVLTQAALSLDWDAVKAAWKKGGEAIEADAQAHFDKLVAIAQKAQDDIEAATMGAPEKAGPTTPTTPPPPGKHIGDDPNQKSQLAAIEEKFATLKAADAEMLAEQGQFQEFSKTMDRDFWQALLGSMKLSQSDRISIQKKIATDTIAIAKSGYEGELAGIKAQEAQYKNNLDAKLALAQQYAAKIAQAEGGDSAHAKQAAGEVLAIERELAAQKLTIAKTNRDAIDSLYLADVETRQKIEEAQVAAGLKTNAQLLADEKKFEDERYQIKYAELQREAALDENSYDRNPVKFAQINAQILALQTSHDAQMLALTIKSVNEQDKYWGDLFSSMNSGFQSTISSFLKGTATIGDTIKGLFQDIGNAVADTLAKMVANWLTTSIQQKIMGKVSALANIQDAAAMAAANAYAATAAIPIFGPELAPEAAAAAYAGAMSFSAIAAKGYDVPANVNPITQLHSKEMVLPEKLGDVIRGMASRGTTSPAQKRAGPMQLALHPSAMRYSLNDWLQSEMARIAATT